MPQNINPNGVSDMPAIYYTVIVDKGQPHPFRSLVLIPSNWTGTPTEMGFFDSQDEAERETKAQYGQDIVYVGVHRFYALVHLRKGEA